MRLSAAMAMTALGLALAGASPARAQNFTKLYDLGSNNQSSNPLAGMIQRGGVFYGTASVQGVDGSGKLYYGSAFTFDPNSLEFTPLHSFLGPDTGNSADGNNPNGGLTEHNGLLYGVTAGGGGTGCGGNGCGQVYSVDPTNGAKTTIYNFQGGTTDGSLPSGTVTFVGDVIYGTTTGGGGACDYGIGGQCGVVYSIDASGREQVVHAFGSTPTDGQGPIMGLVYTHGLLYGVTEGGGTAGGGTIYTIDPTKGAENQVFSFGTEAHGNIFDGLNPVTSLTEANGLLYGTTYFGGRGDAGLVYQLDPATNAFSVVRYFGGKLGFPRNPNGPVIYAHKRLYGVTQHYNTTEPVGPPEGAVYEINPANGVLRVLATFASTRVGDNYFYLDGATPVGRLLYFDGALYGVTLHGGQYGGGVIYKIVP